MSVLREWIHRLRHFGRAERFEDDLAEEIRCHLEMRAAELEQSGLSPRDALSQAHREFGSLARAQEDSRAAWHFVWLQDLAADLRYALRTCRRTPAFTLTAVLSLALGIGGASAIYTALDALLWKPVPVAHPEELVQFSISRDRGPAETDVPAAFVNQLRSSGIFAGLAVNNADGLTFTYDGRAERILGEFVSPDFFDVLGVPPLLGQGFTRQVRAGQWAPEAVLSYNFWQRRFGGDPAVIGRTIHLNTYPFTIVGVSPPSFFGLVRGTDYELRIPLLPEGRGLAQIEQISGSPDRWLNVTGRLKPGSASSQAEAAAEAQFQQFLRTTTSKRFRNAGLRHLQISPNPRGYDEYVLPFHTPLYVLLVLAALVLLIACSNVANMLLARAGARTREFAIRTSIGAGRLRLIRQMLAESMLLSLLGGALGLAVANGAAGLLFHFLPQGHINLAIDLHPDSRALLFTFTLSLWTGLAFGLAPAVQATRRTLAGALKNDSTAAAGAGAGAGFRKLLLISQVAFSLVLLIAAGAFVRMLSSLRPTGYRNNPGRILLFTIKPQQEIYPDDRRRWLAAELIRRVSALPGVQSAALAENGPLGSRNSSDAVQALGHNPIRVDSDSITPGFFDTTGIPRISGRDFDAHDGPAAPPVVIVNQKLARTLFPNQDPIGQSLTIPLGKQDGAYQIIGVVADTRYYDLHQTPQPLLWFSIAQISPYLPTLHVRTNSSDNAAMIAAIRREFDLLDKGFPVFNIRTMGARIEDSLAGERMVASLSGAFGSLALLLAAVGLDGILAYSVSRRTREIGIRMALGASQASVLSAIAREAFVLVAAGSAAGTVLALVASRVLPHYWHEVIPAIDPAIAVACILGMFAVTAAAVAIPAMRGCRIDPLRALRQD